MTYRKIDPKMWDDEWFAALPTEAKLVWVCLLTGPQTTALPGLSKAGIAALAEVTRLDPAVVKAALDRICADQKAHFDEVCRVVRVPNAPRYNPPDNPNVLRGWWNQWQSFPDCQDKRIHLETIRGAVEEFLVESKPFREMWDKTFGTVYGKQKSPPSGTGPDSQGTTPPRSPKPSGTDSPNHTPKVQGVNPQTIKDSVPDGSANVQAVGNAPQSPQSKPSGTQSPNHRGVNPTRFGHSGTEQEQNRAGAGASPDDVPDAAPAGTAAEPQPETRTPPPRSNPETDPPEPTKGPTQTSPGRGQDQPGKANRPTTTPGRTDKPSGAPGEASGPVPEGTDHLVLLDTICRATGGKVRFHDVVGDTAIEFKRRTNAMVATGLTFEDLRDFGQWLVEGGPDNTGGFFWTNCKSFPGWRWLLSEPGRYEQAIVEACAWGANRREIAARFKLPVNPPRETKEEYEARIARNRAAMDAHPELRKIVVKPFAPPKPLGNAPPPKLKEVASLFDDAHKRQMIEEHMRRYGTWEGDDPKPADETSETSETNN